MTQASISEFCFNFLEGSKDRDASLFQILSFLPDAEKSKLHFQKLLEHKDKRIVKLLDSTCGIQTTDQVTKTPLTDSIANQIMYVGVEGR